MLKLAIISVEAAQKERGDSWYSVFGAVRVPPKGPLIVLFDPSVRFKNSSTALLQIRIKYNAGGLTKIYRLIGIWGNIWQQPRRLYANNSTTSANISNVTDTHAHTHTHTKDLTKIFGVICNLCVLPKIHFLYICHKVLDLPFERGRKGAIVVLCSYLIVSLMF